VTVSAAFELTHPWQALEHYGDLAGIKRAIVHTNVLQPEVSLALCLVPAIDPIPFQSGLSSISVA
jgi:hypothetical protein